MPEVSQQIFLGTDQVFAFYDNKFSGINSFEKIILGGSVDVGTAKWFNVPTNARFAFGTADFTVETFAKFTSGASTNREIMSWDADGGFGWGYNSSNQLLCFQAGVSAIFFTTTLNINQFYHIAYSRSGSNMRCFVDGTQVGTTQTFNNNLTAPAGNMIIGKGRTITWPGRFTNYRITTGTALYTSNFTAPTQPLSAGVSGSLLLLAQTAATFTIDATGLNTISNQGATFNTETPFT